MRKLSFIYAALAVVLIAGCSKPAPSERAPAGAPAVAADSGASRAHAGRSLETKWSLMVRVGNVDNAATTLREKTAEVDGYVANAEASGAGQDHAASLDLRIPSGQIGAFRASLLGLGSVVNDSESTKDVTEARADLEARLLAARTEEARVLAIMQSRTGSMSDVLETEKELARIRDDIERLDAEERGLVARVDYAEVHVGLVPDLPAAWSTPSDSVKRAWKGGVSAASATAVVAAMLAAATAPFVLPIALALLLVCYALRRSRSPVPMA